MPNESTKTPQQQTTAQQLQDLHAQVVTFYKDGHSVEATGKRFDRSYGWAHRILAEAGVLRPHGRRPVPVPDAVVKTAPEHVCS
ncbi:hypothetical protein GCM10009665_71440 [Kitasatospora nipponensis]|uniref:Helix-turn-helix domain-containing protein n=1 Tax=Kitasatospora nipponensis TaxID=258049 RepID=A0ABN1X1W7_9ACTN